MLQSQIFSPDNCNKTKPHLNLTLKTVDIFVLRYVIQFRVRAAVRCAPLIHHCIWIRYQPNSSARCHHQFFRISIGRVQATLHINDKIYVHIYFIHPKLKKNESTATTTISGNWTKQNGKNIQWKVRKKKKKKWTVSFNLFRSATSSHFCPFSLCFGNKNYKPKKKRKKESHKNVTRRGDKHAGHHHFCSV